MTRRLLLLNTDLEIGGTPTVVRELALRLRSPEVETEVACLAPLGPVGEQLLAAGVPVSAFGARRRCNVSLVPRLISLIRRRQIDVVLSFLVHANAIAAMAHHCRRGGSTRWFQSIQTTQPTPRWHWRVQALSARSAEKIIVPTPSVARCAAEWSNVPPEKIAVIPNALSLDDFACKAPPAHAGLPGQTRVGFIGRLDPVKRIGDLIAAIAQLGPEYRLDVFGQGPECESLLAKAKALGLAEGITFHGATTHPAYALANMDVLVLPSSAEGFGLVLIEAMAASVPVIATNAPGIRDVIHQNQTGLLVPIGDPAALAAAIRTIRTDPTTWQQRATSARQYVEQTYSWARILPLYRRVLGLC